MPTFSQRVYASGGVISLSRNVHTPPFLMVVYNAAKVHSRQLLEEVKRQGYDASLVGIETEEGGLTMSESIKFNRLGYWSITAVCITGALAGCEFCIPLLAAVATMPLIRNLADGISAHAGKPV